MICLCVSVDDLSVSVDDLTVSVDRGANLSPFGEIRRFHLEIGHSRESCRSVKKIFVLKHPCFKAS